MTMNSFTLSFTLKDTLLLYFMSGCNIALYVIEGKLFLIWCDPDENEFSF